MEIGRQWTLHRQPSPRPQEGRERFLLRTDNLETCTAWVWFLHSRTGEGRVHHKITLPAEVRFLEGIYSAPGLCIVLLNGSARACAILDLLDVQEAPKGSDVPPKSPANNLKTARRRTFVIRVFRRQTPWGLSFDLNLLDVLCRWIAPATEPTQAFPMVLVFHPASRLCPGRHLGKHLNVEA